MPSTLIEMGFITNPEDARLMSEDPSVFAIGIYNGILNYLGLGIKSPCATDNIRRPQKRKLLRIH